MANSKRKCTGCKERFPVDSMIKLPAGYFHSIACSIEYARAVQHKQRERQIVKSNRDKKASDKAVMVRYRADKESIKPLSKLKSEAQAAVNKYIRARDHGMPCISCGNLPAQKFGGTIDAGHYRSRGAAAHLRFNVFNIHGQCVKCNRYNSGNAVDYRLGLIAKIGIERVEQIENNNTSRKFTADYLKRIKKIFNKKAASRKRRLLFNCDLF